MNLDRETMIGSQWRNSKTGETIVITDLEKIDGSLRIVYSPVSKGMKLDISRFVTLLDFVGNMAMVECDK